MRYLLAADPGKASGIVYGSYSATEPYKLIQRWQVLGGVEGFISWWKTECPAFDDLVVESFRLDSRNTFVADLTPKEIEGAIRVFMRDQPETPIHWQPRTDKAALIGYPPEAKSKTQRQRVRFNFLKQYGLFKPGTQNDDSNDACTHSLVWLKKQKHLPSLLAFWPQ